MNIYNTIICLIVIGGRSKLLKHVVMPLAILCVYVCVKYKQEHLKKKNSV